MSSEMHEMAMDARAVIVRGLVVGVDDSGAVQTVDVQTHDGMLRTRIEVVQPYGIATHAPALGGVALLLAVGGDAGDFVALLPSHVGSRFGGTAEGDVVIYSSMGQRVAIRAGGNIEVTALSNVVLTVGGTSLTVSSDGVAIVGDLRVSGEVVGRALSAGPVHLTTHRVSGVQAGSSQSGPPVPGS